MAVWMLERDRPQGGGDSGEVIESPSSAEIEAAVRALNQKERTLVMLYQSPEKHMAVGGGNGQYVAYITEDGRSFSKLVSSTPDTGTLCLVVGGQVGDYPRSQCVSLDEVLRAVREFADRGFPNPELRWVVEPRHR